MQRTQILVGVLTAPMIEPGWSELGVVGQLEELSSSADPSRLSVRDSESLITAVHLGIAGGVFCGPYCNTRKGRGRARQFQPGDCDPNCDHFDLRVVHRCFHQEPVHLEYRKTNLDLSDPIGHCHRLILDVTTVDKLSVVIAIALEKPRRVRRLGTSRAAILLHQQLTWRHPVGGLLIFSGATVLAYASWRP